MSGSGNLRCDVMKHRKFAPKWVPLAGSKRKAPEDHSAGFPDEDFEQPPPKQFAVDDAIVEDITKDGYLLCDVEVDGSKPLEVVEEDEVEMEDEGPQYSAGVKFKSVYPQYEHVNKQHENFGGGGSFNCQHGNDSREHENEFRTIHDIDQLGSLVLSEELRATLARRPSDVSRGPELTIPPSIVEQQYKNAMAVVLWKPRTDMAAVIDQDLADDERIQTEKFSDPPILEDELPEAIIDGPFKSYSCDVEMEEEEL